MIMPSQAVTTRLMIEAASSVRLAARGAASALAGSSPSCQEPARPAVASIAVTGVVATAYSEGNPSSVVAVVDAVSVARVAIAYAIATEESLRSTAGSVAELVKIRLAPS